MYQKDYILRMVKMFGEMIAAILGLIKKGEYKQASLRLDKIYYDMLKRDSSFFHRIPEEELTSKLLRDHNFTNGHLEILAGLFDADAELELAQGNRTESMEYSRKSLIIYEFIDKEFKIYSQERITRMSEIKARIEALQNT